MKGKQIAPFNPQMFLKQVGSGKTNLTCPKKQILFSQGDASDAYSISRPAKSSFQSYRNKAKKPSSQYWRRAVFSGRGVLPGSWCAWPRRPLRKTPLSCALKKPL